MDGITQTTLNNHKTIKFKRSNFMKFIVYCCFVFSLPAIAQQVPNEITDKSKIVKLLPKPPAPPTPVGSGYQYHQLRDMVQIQAKEIKVLSSKIDSLEQRMGRIERRRRY